MSSETTIDASPVPDTSSGVDRRPAAARGRKRDEDRTDTILESAQAVLLDHGFDRFRIQDVATSAGCGTGAIYRRWASKEDLVADAIRSMVDPTIDPTNDPIADLRSIIVAKLDMMCKDPDLMSGLVSAMRTHPVIDTAVRERYTVPALVEAIKRVLGPAHPKTDLLAELAPALVFHRAIFSPDALDAEVVADEVIALTLAVATHDHSSTTQERS